MTRNVVLLTTSEVAGLLRVHEATVRRWASDGTLPPADVPGRNLRFRREDVEALVGTEAVAAQIPSPAPAPDGAR